MVNLNRSPGALWDAGRRIHVRVGVSEGQRIDGGQSAETALKDCQRGGAVPAFGLHDGDTADVMGASAAVDEVGTAFRRNFGGGRARLAKRCERQRTASIAGRESEIGRDVIASAIIAGVHRDRCHRPAVCKIFIRKDDNNGAVIFVRSSAVGFTSRALAIVIESESVARFTSADCSAGRAVASAVQNVVTRGLKADVAGRDDCPGAVSMSCEFVPAAFAADSGGCCVNRTCIGIDIEFGNNRSVSTRPVEFDGDVNLVSSSNVVDRFGSSCGVEGLDHQDVRTQLMVGSGVDGEPGHAACESRLGEGQSIRSCGHGDSADCAGDSGR